MSPLPQLPRSPVRFKPALHALDLAIESPTDVRRARDALTMRAFSRSGDPNLGEFDDAVALKSFGEVPKDLQAPSGA